MVTDSLHYLPVGADRRTIAYRYQKGERPAVLWLPGFRSTMKGLKANALSRYAGDTGRAFWRFDYAGFGRSCGDDLGGDFLDGTISRWLEDAEAIADLAGQPLMVVGSSMGGWIGLRLAERAAAAGRPLQALILIAPAIDMTETLIKPSLTPEATAALARDGVFQAPSAYDDGPYPITRNLIEDGARHLILGRDIHLGCPVHILHGARDPDVPLALSQRLGGSLAGDDVTVTIIPDGDHRLSRPEDLAVLKEIVQRYI